MSKPKFNIDEAINAVASGQHPRRVLFSGAKSSVIDGSVAESARQLLKDASILIDAAKNKVAESDEAVASDLEEQFSGLDNLGLELRKKLFGLGSVQESAEYDDDDMNEEDDDDDDDDDDDEDSNILHFKVSGVSDSAAFKSALKSLVAEHGGVVEYNESFIATEDETITYDTVGGADEQPEVGDDPDDETDTPKKDAMNAVDDLDNPNPDAAAEVDTRESFQFRKTESVMILAKRHQIGKKSRD